MTSDNTRNVAQVRFDGRAVLVTGAGRGIGRAHALLLASRGAMVVVADNGLAMKGDGQSAGPAESVVAEIKAAGGTAVACTADLSTEEGSEAAIATSLEAFHRIDAILHNASTIPSGSSPDQISTRDLDLTMRINLYAGLWMTRAAWPHMKQQGYGRILFTATHGIYGAEYTSIYAAAKSALIGAMRCLAVDGVGEGILVNLLLPSARTRMTEGMPQSAYTDWMNQTMLPELVSPGAAFLLSEECAIHGEMLSVSGGRIARIVLGENEGSIAPAPSIEDVRDAIPGIMADTNFFYPETYSARLFKVAAMLGYTGGENPLVRK